MTHAQSQSETVEIDRETLAALEFQAFGEKSRGNMDRQKEVSQALKEYEPQTDYEESQ